MADPICSSISPKLYTPIDDAPSNSTTSSSTSVVDKKPAVDLEYVPPLPPPAPKKPATSAAPTSATASSASSEATKSVNVSSWPLPLLEREAANLTAKMLEDPTSVSGADRQKLADVEAELSKRYEAMPKPLAAVGPKGVQLCERPADLPGNGTLQIAHQWYKTTKNEAGMGLLGGGVPGHEGGPSGYPMAATEMVDHTGQSALVDAHCEPRPDLDEACVDEEIVLGKPTGLWMPPINDCHTVAADIAEKCEVPMAKPPANVDVSAR